MMRRLPGMIGGGMILILAWILWGGGSHAAAAPLARSPGLVISEVYAPVRSTPDKQWFELHNIRTDASYPLNNLILGTSAVSVTLQTTMTLGPNLPGAAGANSYLLVAFSADGVRANNPGQIPATRRILEVPALGGLNPEADALLLYTRDGLLIDQVNWGVPQPDWPNYSALWNPGLTALADPARSWGRTAPPGGDRDTDTGDGGDWTVHETLSPGARVGAPAPNGGLYLGGMTNWIGVISGFLLWGVFILIGVIAYRFERLRERRTYWQLLLLAPSGILFYTYIVAQGFASGRSALSDSEKWLSFPILAASAVACAVAVAVFQNVARGLLEGE